MSGVGKGREESAPVVRPAVVRWWRRSRRADSTSTFMAPRRGRDLVRARAYTRDLWNFLPPTRASSGDTIGDFSGRFPSYVGGSACRAHRRATLRKVSLRLLIYSRGELRLRAREILSGHYTPSGSQ